MKYISQLSQEDIRQLAQHCIVLSDGLSFSDIVSYRLSNSDLHLETNTGSIIQYFLTDSCITPLSLRHQQVNREAYISYMYDRFGEEYLKELAYIKFGVEKNYQAMQQAINKFETAKRAAQDYIEFFQTLKEQKETSIPQYFR